MVLEATLNISSSFKYDWSKIFIGWGYDKVFMVLEGREEPELNGRKVAVDSASSEEPKHGILELGSSSTDFDRDSLAIWIVGRIAKVELLGVPF